MEVIICLFMNIDVKNVATLLRNWFLAVIKNLFPVPNAKLLMCKGY